MTRAADSSRRAVEAADNVVHAYDLNMQVPDTPSGPDDDDDDDEKMETQPTHPAETRRPSLREGNSIFFRRSKRARTGSTEWDVGPAAKHRMIQSTNSTPHREISPHTASLRTAVEESDSLTSGRQDALRTGKKGKGGRRPSSAINPEITFDSAEHEAVTTPGLRHTQIRDLLHLVVNESLRVGGRPDSAIAQDTIGGEIIDVRTRGPKGDTSSKIIEWSVDADVPDTIFGKPSPHWISQLDHLPVSLTSVGT